MAEDFAHAPALATNGYAVIPGVISSDAIVSLVEVISRVSGDVDARGTSRGLHAMRNLLRIREIRTLADSRITRELIEPVLGHDVRPVRGILFDKTPETNWKVAWHQDLSIAVKRRLDVAGFGPWSMKEGVQHVQPPVEVLERMVTLRVHLDECDEANGPLRVLPGSHVEGILSDERIARWRQKMPGISCICPAGGAVLIRPLLLHASSPATSPRHRRVIHLEYAAGALPSGLEWFEE